MFSLFVLCIQNFSGNYDWKKGFVSGAVYYSDENLIDLLTKVYGIASYTNPLHSDVFPGVCKMEAEVVRICANLFNGGPDACGTVSVCIYIQYICIVNNCGKINII